MVTCKVGSHSPKCCYNKSLAATLQHCWAKPTPPLPRTIPIHPQNQSSPTHKAGLKVGIVQPHPNFSCQLIIKY